MSVDPDFEVASRLAEESLDFLECAKSLAQEGKQDEAQEILKAVALLAGPDWKGLDAIDQRVEDLAVVATGIFESFGHHASAHEAVAKLCETIHFLFALGRPIQVGPDFLEWLGVDSSVLRAGLRQERAKLSKEIPKTETKPEEQRSAHRPTKVSAIESLLGQESQKILGIVRSGQTADAKMRAICAIDLRFLGWNSEQWAHLLGVKGPAIRQTHFWTEGRQKAIDAD
jgi:hypothetical protein